MPTDKSEPPLPWGLAWRLAIGQIVAWGTLYYSFSIVVGPMHEATGWSRPFLNGGLCFGLLVWGLCALPVGVWINRRGARAVMTLASAIGGIALALLGFATQPAFYMAAWGLMGLGMAGLLYEPAFAVITHAFGRDYRRGITAITLVAGFASTVFVPLSQFAVENMGWRGALIALGGLQVAVGVPLHYFTVPPQKNWEEMGAVEVRILQRLMDWFRVFRRDVSERRFIGLALWFAGQSAAFSGMTFLLVPMLQSENVNTSTILGTVVIIGPMQVAGRLLLTAWIDHFAVLRVGVWSMSSLIAALLVLLFLPHTMPWLALFAVLYGGGLGIMTILRGSAIAELFGRDRYAELNGALSAPSMLANAAAPLVLATLWSKLGSPVVIIESALVLLFIGVAGLSIARSAPRNR